MKWTSENLNDIRDTSRGFLSGQNFFLFWSDVSLCNTNFRCRRCRFHISVILIVRLARDFCKQNNTYSFSPGTPSRRSLWRTTSGKKEEKQHSLVSFMLCYVQHSVIILVSSCCLFIHSCQVNKCKSDYICWSNLSLQQNATYLIQSNCHTVRFAKWKPEAFSHWKLMPTLQDILAAFCLYLIECSYIIAY